MTVKRDPSDLYYSLEGIREELENIISSYLKTYADYGWDSITEDLVNVAAQLYKDEILLKNAEVNDSDYT